VWVSLTEHKWVILRKRRGWHIEHKSALGSCPDFSLIEAMTPKRANDADTDLPSKNWQDYLAPLVLPRELGDRVANMTDLVS
jgi:hypothetical protein